MDFHKSSLGFRGGTFESLIPSSHGITYKKHPIGCLYTANIPSRIPYCPSTQVRTDSLETLMYQLRISSGVSYELTRHVFKHVSCISRGIRPFAPSPCLKVVKLKKTSYVIFFYCSPNVCAFQKTVRSRWCSWRTR